jgi:predicted AAA+ superfamily ATPase
LKIPNSDFGNREFFTLKIPHAMWDFQGKIRNASATSLSPKNRDIVRCSCVTALIGPRQCGKTTLAREWVEADSLNYFDLKTLDISRVSMSQ